MAIKESDVILGLSHNRKALSFASLGITLYTAKEVRLHLLTHHWTPLVSDFD